MRTFAPVAPPKDMDPRVYKVLKRQNDYLQHVGSAFGKITGGTVPDQSGTTIIEAPVISDHGALDGLVPVSSPGENDDHTQYALLAGRTAGQYLYGSRQVTGSTWDNRGTFTTQKTATDSNTWAGIAVDNAAPIGTLIFLTLGTYFSTDPAATGGETAYHDGITDSGGNSWTKLREETTDEGHFQTLSIWYTVITTALSTSSTLNIEYTPAGSATVNRGMLESYSFNVGAGTTVSLVDEDVDNQTSGAPSQPSALTLTATGETMYLRAITTREYSASADPELFTPTGSFTPLTTDHSGSTLLDVGYYSGTKAEFRVLSEGVTSEPSISTAIYSITSVMVAVQLVPSTGGLLNLSSAKTAQNANILLSGSTIFANMDFLYFRDAGGTANLSYIDGSDGSFNGPVNWTSISPENWLRLDCSNDPLTGDLDFNTQAIDNLSVLNWENGQSFDGQTPNLIWLDGAQGIRIRTVTDDYTAMFSGGTSFITRRDDQSYRVLDAYNEYLGTPQRFRINCEDLSQGFSVGTATSHLWFLMYNSVNTMIIGSAYVRVLGDLDVDGVINQSIAIEGSVKPTVTDDTNSGYQVGGRWLDTTSSREYVATDVTAGAAVWLETTNNSTGVTRAYVPAGVTVDVPDRHQIVVSGLYEVEATGLLDLDTGGKLVVLKEVA